jgi:arsenate reductase
MAFKIHEMKTYNVLFLCTHNSARSILGEALASTQTNGRFIGFSAGSLPGKEVNPIARTLAIEAGYPAEKMYSKSWGEYALVGAPRMDFIITVCDNAAGETCPFWPGNPATTHWGFPDPSKVQGSYEDKRSAFATLLSELRKRIQLLAASPLEDQSLQAALKNADSTYE